MDKNEQLLNKEEIDIVLNEAKYSMLNNPGFIGKFTKHYLDIFSISWVKKLIFIQGTSYTGLNHINERHRYFTNAHSPIQGNKFTKTSRFSMDSGTLSDYIKISEALFDNKNLNVEKNKVPDKFDLYENKIDFLDNRLYRLLTYKDTKIVHTLFPIDSGKKVAKFMKGDVQVEYQDSEFARLVVPYVDSNSIVQYGIGVRIFLAQKIEKWTLLIYKNSNLYKKAELFELPYVNPYNMEIRFEQINYQDVSKIEKFIYELEKKGVKDL